jgi:hypothetical protein
VAALYTYDLTTPIGQARLHASDTNVDDLGADLGNAATFTDAELAYFLSISSQEPILAAAFALEALAADKSKLALRLKNSEGDSDLSGLAADLRAQADRLRSICNIGGSVQSPDAIFTTDNALAGVMGSMDGW